LIALDVWWNGRADVLVAAGETRKRFSSLYSMSSLVHYEEFVDQCADVFFDRLGEFADRDVKFNLGEWFQFYAFDVIGEITYGERFGWLPSIIATIYGYMLTDS
jgi:hypothetical protein